MNRESMREGFVEMLRRLEPDYSFTLNLNQDFSYLNRRARCKKGEEYFKHFCQYLDRKVIGSRYMKHHEQRAIVVATPEHIDTNYHLHGYIKMRCKRQIPFLELETAVLTSWREVIPSGTALLEVPSEERGWSRYISKESGRRDWFDGVLISLQYCP